jgi:hypothetical protein
MALTNLTLGFGLTQQCQAATHHCGVFHGEKQTVWVAPIATSRPPQLLTAILRKIMLSDSTYTRAQHVLTLLTEPTSCRYGKQLSVYRDSQCADRRTWGMGAEV